MKTLNLNIAAILLAGFLAGPMAHAADADGDGVDDALDLCAGTVVPEGVPTTGSLGPHRYALITALPTFDNNDQNIATPDFTIVDTAGCSCEQILANVGAGSTDSQIRRGCTIETMLEWVAPTTTVTIDSITDDTGTAGDFITSDDDGLTIAATLSAALAAGEILEYSNDNGATFTDISGSVSGTAVIHVDAALTSTNTIQMRVKNTFGNSGAAASQLVTIDTTAPTTTVTIDSITDDTGTPGDFITSDNDGLTIGATLSAALAAGEKLEYSNDNGATFTDISGSVSGTAVIHVDAALTSTNTVEMRVTDTAGNNGTTASQLVTIDTAAPTTTVVIDSITDDTGTPGDFITSDDDGLTIGATLSAALAAGEKLEYSNDNGATFTDISASVSGTAVTHLDAALTSTNTIQMRVTNAVGNSGPAASQLVTIDTAAPTTTVTIDSITDDTGTPGDFITNDNDGLTIGATLSAALAAGEKLEYSNDNGTTFSDISGSVSGTAVIHVDAALTSTNTIQMRVTDAVGNNGTAATQLVTIDTTAPTTTVTINSITDDTGTPGDFITNDDDGLTISATLSAGLAAGEILEYSNDNGATFIAISGSVSGTAVIHVDAALTSTNTIQMRVTDAVGNSGTTASQLVTIDTTAPTTTVTIDSITDDTGTPGDFITNDDDGLTIGATLSAALAAGEKLEYSNDNGVTFSDITTSVTGTAVSHVDAALTNSNTIQMRVADGANIGPIANQSVTVDTTAPTTTVAINSITDDTGTPGDFITSDDDGLTIGATLSAALAAGEKLEYSNDNGTAFADISGSVSGTAVSHIDAGLTSTNTIQMRVVDAAGNNGPAASQLITIMPANTPPTGGPDSYDFVGNTLLLVDKATTSGPEIIVGTTGGTTPAADGVLDNDTDAEDAISVAGVRDGTSDCADMTAPFTDCPTANGGKVTMESDGTFSYVPKAGDALATDTFQYKLSDGVAPPVNVLVTLTRKNRVWYVKNDNTSGTDDGTSVDPYDTLAEAASSSVIGDTIFVFEGAGTTAGQDSGITLKDSQRLLGEGVDLTVPDTVNGVAGPTVFDSATNPQANIQNVAGDAIMLASDNTIRGLDIGDTPPANWGINESPATTFGTLTISDVAITGTGGLFQASAGTLDVTFDSLTSTSSSFAPFNVSSVPGSLLVLNGTTISGATSPGNSAISVLNTGGAGNSYDFGDTSINTAGAGVHLQNNTSGPTFTFDSLDITTAGIGHGILALNTGTLTIDGTDNVIVKGAGLGIAVRIENTDIGTLGAGPPTNYGVTFKSITSSGGSNGIILDNVGTGGFQVTGDASTTQGGNDSGGVISNTTGDGIVLDTASSVTLRRMTIGDSAASAADSPDNTNNIAGDGIQATGVTDLTLEFVTIARTGGHGLNAVSAGGAASVTNLAVNDSLILNAGDGQEEHGLNLDELRGDNFVRDSLFDGFNETGIELINTSGTVDLTVDNTTFQDNQATVGNAGEEAILIEAQGTAQIVALVTGTAGGGTASIFDDIARQAIQAISLGTTSDIQLTVENSRFDETASGDAVIIMNPDNTGSGNLTVKNNVFTDDTAGPFAVVAKNDSSGTLDVTVQGNTATEVQLLNVNHDDIGSGGAANGTTRVLVGGATAGLGNTVTHIANNVIAVDVIATESGPAGTAPDLSLTVMNNTTSQPDGNFTFSAGLRVDVQNDSRVNLNISSNAFQGDPTCCDGAGIELKEQNAAVVGLQGFAGGAPGNCAATGSDPVSLYLDGLNPGSLAASFVCSNVDNQIDAGTPTLPTPTTLPSP